MKKNLYYGLVGCLMGLASLNASAQSDSPIELDRGDSLVLNAKDGFSFYSWQVSSDKKHFQDIPNAKKAHLNIKVYTPGYYRVKATRDDYTSAYLDTVQVNMKAYKYSPQPSISGGAHGFIETTDGKPGAGGISVKEDREGSVAGSSIPLTNWTNGKSMVVYYLKHPQNVVDTKMELTVVKNKNVAFRIKVFDPSDMSTPLAENILAFKGTGEPQTVDLIGLRFRKNIYYRYQLECLEGWNNIVSISKYYHYSPSRAKTYKSGYLSSPSVHLDAWRSTEPGAPAGKAYDWCYLEVMMPEESDIPGTYVMSLGVLKGYMGIQMNGYKNGKQLHDVIFSMWDDGDTDKDPNLPDNLRANVVDHGPGVHTERFANEGTGMKSFKSGYNWDCGKFVQFITNCRPEDATYIVKEDGKEVVKHQKNTLCSTWYNAQDGKGWQYMATLRLANKQINFDSWYSFLENYNWPTGQALRRGYYRNGYGHAKDAKKWFHFNQVSFSHTDGNGGIGSRDDYGMGECNEFNRTYFMTTGGFIPTNITGDKVDLNKENTPVDTINLDNLLVRVDQAIANEKAKIEAKENFTKNKIVKDGWKVIDFSSEEKTGEAGGKMGLAQQIVDNDYETYWHSQWQGGTAKYPHHFVVDMGDLHDINGVQICSSNGNKSNRTIKAFDFYLSQDNKTWEKVHSETNSPNEVTIQFLLKKITKARYFKLVINEGHANEGPFVRVNEIDLTEGQQTGIESAAKNEMLIACSHNELLVKAPTTLTNAEFSVFRADGACIATHNYDSLSEGEIVRIPMSIANKGVYVVSCKADNFNISKQFIWNK